MPPRPRLFVKKRGTRRTGARWAGKVGEGMLFIALLLIGACGLYWLIANVLLVGEESPGWWPWFAMLIPIALLVSGATGLILLLWQNAASTERRAVVVQRATDWDVPGTPTKPGRPAPAAVPAIDAIVDSAGTELAYRLPIDAASGWVSLTMAAICLVWNTLVAVFVAQVVRDYFAGKQNWLLIWLMVPFVMAGLWTLVALGRQVWLTFAVGTTRLEISQHPLYPGRTYQALVSQSGRLHVRWFQVLLVSDEQAIYQQGTDTRRASARVHRAMLFSQRKFDITPREAFETWFDVTIPDSAMHSFVSTHNAVTWALVVRGRTARWGDFERRFPVYVYPISVAPQSSDNAQMASAQTS